MDKHKCDLLDKILTSIIIVILFLVFGSAILVEHLKEELEKKENVK